MMVKYNVSNETKKKRRWVFKILVFLLFFSFFLSFLGLNRDISLALMISFAVALILKMVEWIEHSDLIGDDGE